MTLTSTFRSKLPEQALEINLKIFFSIIFMISFYELLIVFIQFIMTLNYQSFFI